MDLMWAIYEIFQFVPYKEHIEEHEEASKLLGYNIDNDTITHEEHVAAHLEYRRLKGMLTKEQEEKLATWKENRK